MLVSFVLLGDWLVRSEIQSELILLHFFASKQ